MHVLNGKHGGLHACNCCSTRSPEQLIGLMQGLVALVPGSFGSGPSPSPDPRSLPGQVTTNWPSLTFLQSPCASASAFFSQYRGVAPLQQLLLEVHAALAPTHLGPKEGGDSMCLERTVPQ